VDDGPSTIQGLAITRFKQGGSPGFADGDGILERWPFPHPFG